MCHWTGDLLPAPGEDPVYAQLYIYDPAEALQTRMSHNPETTRETMEALQEELAPENLYAESYRNMHEVLRDAEAEAARSHSEVPEVRAGACERTPRRLWDDPRSAWGNFAQN